MKGILLVFALLATASASLSIEDTRNLDDDIRLQGKWTLNDRDIRVKQKIVLKLLNHILQPTMYGDILECSRTYVIEDNIDKYVKIDIVKDFLYNWKVGMLPRGEIFTISNLRQMRECIKVFHVLYYAKDFDTFVKSACWMRERINEGMFVYALSVAVLHREDCRGIILPTPCEIYPYYFINSDVIHKAYLVKMRNGDLDKKLASYYNIRITDKNVVLIDDQVDSRGEARKEDRLAYFTEDIGLNTYYYYFHLEYPIWMSDDGYGISKERRGELYYYVHQQLIARYNLERLSNYKCDVKQFDRLHTVKTSYWPRLTLHTGIEIPARNDFVFGNTESVHLQRLVQDYSRRIRDAIIKGHIILRDGTRVSFRKPEDIEYLGRLLHGNLDKEDVKFYRYLIIFVKALMRPTSVSDSRYTYTTPSILDQWETCLRDPVFWKLQARLVDDFVLFKKYLPSYTRDELDFPGVKIENVVTDKLVTFFDRTDVDITNSVILSDEELKKQQSDKLFVARKERLNHHPFNINIDVLSDKTVDSVVRIFLGPKYDCEDRKRHLNDRRHNFVEIDSFDYSLQSGKNTIVRESRNMHNLIEDRVWARRLLENRDVNLHGFDYDTNILNMDYYRRNIVGFPQRLLLPKGRRGGLELQLLVHIAPRRTDRRLQDLYEIDEQRLKTNCRYTTCIDTRSLGYPLDREIDSTNFFTNNLRVIDVLIFHKREEVKADLTRNEDIERPLVGRSLDRNVPVSSDPGLFY